MSFPEVNTTINAEIAGNQAVKLIVTVNGLSTLAAKIVALRVQFTEVANNKFGYFSKFVPMAVTTTNFIITVPYPDNLDPNTLVAANIIQSADAEYYFVDGDPNPLNN